MSLGVHCCDRVVSQLDVLAHPAVALFVSHCGTTSVFEATLLGVPVMCVPVLPSQSITGALMLRVGAMASMVDHLSPTLQLDIETGARCGAIFSRLHTVPLGASVFHLVQFPPL